MIHLITFEPNLKYRFAEREEKQGVSGRERIAHAKAWSCETTSHSQELPVSNEWQNRAGDVVGGKQEGKVKKRPQELWEGKDMISA